MTGQSVAEGGIWNFRDGQAYITATNGVRQPDS
jgi:hypothetical protein